MNSTHYQITIDLSLYKNCSIFVSSYTINYGLKKTNWKDEEEIRKKQYQGRNFGTKEKKK